LLSGGEPLRLLARRNRKLRLLRLRRLLRLGRLLRLRLLRLSRLRLLSVPCLLRTGLTLRRGLRRIVSRLPDARRLRSVLLRLRLLRLLRLLRVTGRLRRLSVLRRWVGVARRLAGAGVLALRSAVGRLRLGRSLLRRLRLLLSESLGLLRGVRLRRLLRRAGLLRVTSRLLRPRLLRSLSDRIRTRLRRGGNCTRGRPRFSQREVALAPWASHACGGIKTVGKRNRFAAMRTLGGLRHGTS
jgi:hypothetical protein